MMVFIFSGEVRRLYVVKAIETGERSRAIGRSYAPTASSAPPGSRRLLLDR
jgi:hypothetical protein